MKTPHPGNGSGKFDVTVHNMGGWIRVFAGGTAPQDGSLPTFLAHRLSHWFRDNPHLRLTAVVPISREGNTVELHAWYEQHLFPDSSPLATQVDNRT